MNWSKVEAVECDWHEIEEQIAWRIADAEAAGWELHQVAGPTFSGGSHVLLVFKRPDPVSQ